VGLGLQETFKDLFSGVILLFERRAEVGDVVEVDGLIGTVKRIGVRTSLVETRDNIVVIVPNSRLIVQHFVNWSHNDNKARFYIQVGVAYGSDTELVRQLLLDIARSNAEVIRHPAPFVRFVDFGNSSLDFQLHFWSHEFIRIEDVKSDMRFKIDQAFRENGVTIPFPQRDVWMKGGG
jgi:small-conductance mechanosensitive channel